jgi:6-phosphogluconolactonase
MNTAAQKFLYKGTETEITEHAAALIISEAYRAVKEHGRFSLVLAGGNSPRSLYRQLARGVDANTMEHYQLQFPLPDGAIRKGNITCMPWEKTWLFWGDERCVSFDNQESNYRMARETLLSEISIAENHIFRMPAEQKDEKEAARRYEESIRNFFMADGSFSGEEFPMFDLVILGLGEDGHTASLFADNKGALQVEEQWVVAVNEPLAKPPGKRLTLTLPIINHARNVLFFTLGKEKAALAEKIFLEKEIRVPASLVVPVNGKTYWFTAQL